MIYKYLSLLGFSNVCTRFTVYRKKNGGIQKNVISDFFL